MLSFATLLALAYAFQNGVQDAGNSISTVVSTRVLRPLQAVVWAAAFNLASLLLWHTAVAATMATGFIEPARVEPAIVIGALAGAMGWGLLAMRVGLPTSSTQALLAALIGAALTIGGTGTLQTGGVLRFLGVAVLAPIAAAMLAVLLMVALYNAFARVEARGADRLFRRLQLLSSAAVSLGHGANDAQRTAGLLWLLLIASGSATADRLPTWVSVTVTVALACGTLVGGWRLIRTMDQRLVRLTPVSGFGADCAAAATIHAGSLAGIPLSTTQSVRAAVIGTGMVNRIASVRWGIASMLIRAALVTLPAAALFGAIAAWIAAQVPGVAR